jgi:hypothetical protein
LATSSRLSTARPARFCLRQQFRLERLQARGQRRSALQNFLGADEPKGAKSLGQPSETVIDRFD